MENKIKTGIKMRVNAEQYIKVQEICFANGISWSVGKGLDRDYYPYLWVDECISRGSEEYYFINHRAEEVDADLFIRTNGTCIEEVIEDIIPKEEKEYLVYVQNKGIPKVKHTLDSAEKEAKRLAEKEIGRVVHIVQIIKSYVAEVSVKEI